MPDAFAGAGARRGRRCSVGWALITDQPIVCTAHIARERVDAGEIVATVPVATAPTSTLRARVRAGRDPQPTATATATVIDSQNVRGADTVAATTSGYDAGKKIKGRKRHIATDTNGLLLAAVVTPASIQDRDAAHRLLAAVAARFAAITFVWADGGYAGRLLIWARSVLTQTVQIVKRSDTASGFEILPRRWVAERTFGWLVEHRRLVRDYETRPDHHEAMVYIASIHTLTRRSARDSGPAY